MPDEPAAVEKPEHPLHALTTYELTGHRRQLERAITFYSSQDPVPAIQAAIQARLDAVTAEQDDRARIARA
jgi:hypothetical protein